jgi:hypothetical protein
MTTMPREVLLLLSCVAVIVILFGLLVTYSVVGRRERVKRAICDAGFKPIRVGWRSFAYWAPVLRNGTAFNASYSDATGLPRRARFWVGGGMFGCRNEVRWISPEAGHLWKPLSRLQQFVYGCFSLLGLGFGIRTLLVHEVLLPLGTRANPVGTHLHGWPKNLLALAALCLAGALLTHFAYHYSRQTDERRYRLAARAFATTSWLLFLLSLATNMYQRFAR